MTIDFYTEHIKTICDLQALAEKHNCKLSFGTRAYAINTDDTDDLLVEDFNCTEEIAEEIKSKCSFEITGGLETEIYFDLFEKDVNKYGKYNVLGLRQREGLLKITHDSFEEPLSLEALEWLRDNWKNGDWGLEDEDYFYLYINSSKTIVDGFEGVKQEWSIYREGIMLAVFTQLVCDYLHEERIVRTYS